MQNPTPTDKAYALAAGQEFAREDEHQEAIQGALGPILVSEFLQAELDRRDTEIRWLRDLRQYKGQYDADVLASIGPQRSKAFVRKTRVKVKTADSRVADLLFPAGSEKNWTIENTPVPTVSPEHRAKITQLLTQAAQGQPPAKEDVDKAILEMATKSAKGMSKVIEDQLVEARYKKASLQAIHSGHLYGTGIIKGPLVERRIRTQFVMKHGKWVPQSQTYITPFVDYVPLWRFYPDMSATELEDCRYVYERHLMTRAKLAELANRKSFKGDVIKAYILANPDGQVRALTLDTELKSIGERDANQSQACGQYEVLERWGYLTGVQLVEAGATVPEDRLHESFFSNAWILANGEVIKAVLQPINGVTWPYHLYYFDKDETSIFPEGLASVMCDDQTMINAGTRMSLDNGAITAGAMVEVATSLLSNTEKTNEIHPHKVWLRNATNPGQRAVVPIDLPSHLGDLFQLIQLFEGNADEVTAIPRYMTGENATQGAAGTASGMSMLMGAANIVIKDLVSNWDEGVTRPFLQALYRWNMQFSQDDTIKGDFDVKARGTASLVAKEVRARQLNDFAVATANELDAPFIKRDKLNQQRAEANELSDVVKTAEEMQADASNPQAQQAQQAQQALQEAQMQTAKATLDKLVAEAQRTLAQAEQIKAQAMATAATAELTKARTMETKVSTTYAAMQAGGVATERPEIAPAGDEILRSAGWVDATPAQDIAPVQAMPQEPMQPMPEQPMQEPMTGQDGANVGMHQGIETAAIDG